MIDLEKFKTFFRVWGSLTLVLSFITSVFSAKYRVKVCVEIWLGLQLFSAFNKYGNSTCFSYMYSRREWCNLNSFVRIACKLQWVFRRFPEKDAQRAFDHNFHLCNFLLYVLYPKNFVTNKNFSITIKETMTCIYSDRPISTLYLLFKLPARLSQVWNTIHFRASYKGFIRCAEACLMAHSWLTRPRQTPVILLGEKFVSYFFIGKSCCILPKCWYIFFSWNATRSFKFYASL